MSWAPDIRIARVHDAPDAMPGAGLLVDRVWPRGVKKAVLRLDEWVRDVAPTPELRKWFGHDPAKGAELDDNPRRCGTLPRLVPDWPVTLLFAAKDREHNQAVVLRDHLAERLA